MKQTIEEKKIKEFISKWDGRELEDAGCVMSNEAKQFSRALKAVVSTICKNRGYTLVTHTTGHYFCSGFIKKDTAYVYYHYDFPRSLQLDLTGKEHRYMDSILVRSAKDNKDFTGGQNQFCHIYSFAGMVDGILCRSLNIPQRAPFLEICKEPAVNVSQTNNITVTASSVKKDAGQITLFDMFEIA